MYTIYGLIDPRDGKIKYIGSTSSTPARRLAYHLNESSRNGNKKVAWLSNLIESNQLPGFVILQEESEQARAQSAEKWWISHGLLIGWELTNGTHVPSPAQPKDYDPEYSIIDGVDLERIERECERGASVYQDTGKWDDVFGDVFERWPDIEQSAMRIIMALIADDKRHPNAFKGEAFRLYHAYSTNGNRS